MMMMIRLRREWTREWKHVRNAMALVETSEGNQHFWDQSVQIDNVDDDGDDNEDLD